MWLIVVCHLIDKNARHHSGQNVNKFSRFSLINASRVVWTRIVNGKLANQNARLVAIVLKMVLKHLVFQKQFFFCKINQQSK